MPFRHLQAGETDADSSVGRRRRYEVPAHHIRGIDAGKAGTGHGTCPLGAAVVVVIGPVALGRCNTAAAFRVEAYNGMAERCKAVVGEELRLPFQFLRDAAGGRRVWEIQKVGGY